MMVRTRGLPPQGSHRSVLAQLTHTAPHLMHTLPWRRLVVTLTQPPASKDRPCFPPKPHETLPPSLSRVPWVSSPGSTVLRDAPTPVRPSRRTSLPSFGDTTLAPCLLPAAGTRDRGLRGVGMPVPEPDMSVETDGSLRFPSHPRVPAPCSWTPVGPNTPGHCGVSTRPPLMSTTEAPAMNISGLDSTALGLAVYASQ